MTSLRTCGLFASLAVLFAACSGSSGAGHLDPGAGAAQQAHIVNNTAGGADGRLFGRVNAIALEDGQGQMTANLVTGNPEFVLSDPAGATSGLELADFGPGKFIAVHVSFLPGSLKLKKGNGTPIDVTLVGGSIKAPFASPLDVKTIGAYRIELRHNGKVVINKDPQGNLTWKPDMVADASGPVLLQDVAIEIMSVDVANGTAQGIIQSLTGIKTTVKFLSNAVLVIGADEKTVTEFLNGLVANDVIRVFGLLDGASNTHVAFGELDEGLTPGSGNGRKNKVRGTITSVDHKTATMDLSVFDIRIGGRDIPKDRPVTLSVDNTEAKIKYVPRYGRHKAHLEPKALAPDMFVEVEWHGDAPKLEVVAHKVNIRSDGRFDFLSKVAGMVKSVDANAGTITLEKAGGEKFFFGKESYSTLTIHVGSDTLLVEDKNGVAVGIDLANIRNGEDIWLLGRKQTGAEIAAMLVVVER